MLIIAFYRGSCSRDYADLLDLSAFSGSGRAVSANGLCVLHFECWLGECSDVLYVFCTLYDIEVILCFNASVDFTMYEEAVRGFSWRTTTRTKRIL